jgi:LytTr DNA-binding domain
MLVIAGLQKPSALPARFFAGNTIGGRTAGRCRFLRIHKSFLINLLHVKEGMRSEGGSVILSTGQEMEVNWRKKIFYQ